MRASMSAPGVFAPVEVDGRLLVDGGIVENLPVDVSRRMGVDIVIAVDVGFQLVGRKRAQVRARGVEPDGHDHDAARDLRQRGLLSGNDVLIEPDLGNMLSMDFAACRAIHRLGLAATRPNARQLEAPLARRSGVADLCRARSGREPAQPVVHFVRTDARSERYSERIQAELSP